MCNEKQVENWAKAMVSRRQFGLAAGASAAVGSLAGCTTMGGTGALTESMVSIPTGTGMMDAFFVRPAGTDSPAVLFWPDIAGIRESKRQMARRLAGEGYAVLVANPYYRDVTANQFADFASFAADGGFQKVRPWRQKLDAEAVIAWLDRQDGVDSSAGVGTQGYCMGGPFAVWTAAAVPSRVRAAASFHGGGLVREGANSPHRMVDESRAGYLVAIAQDVCHVAVALCAGQARSTKLMNDPSRGGCITHDPSP